MYYPIMLNVENKKAVLVGGGSVGFRKSKRLVEAGADLIVISPDLDDRFKEIEGKFQHIRDLYKISYIGSAHIVIAATSSREVNHKIAKDCENLDILSNIVDNKEESSFITPAIVDKQGLMLAISSKGSFPALSKYIKKDLETRYDKFDRDYMDLLEKLRGLVLEDYFEDRKEIFYRALELEYDELKDMYEKLIK